MNNLKNIVKLSIISLAALSSLNTSADQVFNDDVIITFSACIGNDCVNGENFGFDTLRLKENNVRIGAVDTSNSASFPSNDWQITFNDSSNGGANKFSIDDIDGGRTPFTIEAGADSNALYVDDGGRVGFGTSTPVVDLHVTSGNTPTLRLEQDGSSGFTAQTWDLAGNETNFFVRDATNGSKLPFKIRPGAATDSLYIDTDGDIGLGDSSPDAALDIDAGAIIQPVLRLSSTSTTHSIVIEDDDDPSIHFIESTEPSNQFILGVDGDQGNGYGIINTSNTRRSLLFQPNGNFVLHTSADKVNDTWAMVINGADSSITFGGDVDVKGTFTNTSSRDSKHKISKVAGEYILDKLARLNISSWTYKTDLNQATHIGPMAEDFFSIFKIGKNDKTISPMDTAGVSLAAAKALNEKVNKQEQEIKELKKLVLNLSQQ